MDYRKMLAGGSSGKIEHNVSTALMHNTPERSNAYKTTRRQTNSRSVKSRTG